MPNLTLLHLSDIHFSVFKGDNKHDLDGQVRDRMVADIESLHTKVGDMDAVLVVGDIAGTGRQEEFDLASQFLDRVCEIVGCAPDRVICVPGNHDIDRSMYGALHNVVRSRLRQVPAAEASEELHRLLVEPRGADLLLEPLGAYNTFALRYGCDLAPDRLTWNPKQFALGSREVLVYGLTSPWICDSTDSDKTDERKVLLGEFQCGQVASSPDSISIALVHHPFNWLRDGDRASQWLACAQLVLTGHEHAAGITPDAVHRNLAIASGAVNPMRTDHGWTPAYNVICLSLPDEGSDLAVDVHIRCWQKGRAEFGPDPRFDDPYRAPIKLGDSMDEQDARDELPTPDPAPSPEPIGSNQRAMIFRVMRASPDVRLKAARELGLVSNEDLRGLEMDRHILDEAVRRDAVAELDGRLCG